MCAALAIGAKTDEFALGPREATSFLPDIKRFQVRPPTNPARRKLVGFSEV
jgi:hypothetical protein